MEGGQIKFYASILLFAIISWALYKYVLTGNTHSATAVAAPTDGHSSTSSTDAAATTTRSASLNANSGTATASDHGSVQQNNRSIPKDESASSSFASTYLQHKRRPPHLSSNTASNKQLNNNTNNDGGVIPFKSTHASGYETRLSKTCTSQEDVILTNRKQRARLFAKLFSIKDRPPNRGSNVVVIISYNDGANVKCDKLQKSLMLLGTYYNLFLVVDCISSSGEEVEYNGEMVKQFRNDLLNVTTSDKVGSNGNKLCTQILPPHRVIFTSTPEGKVAFVRQLPEAKLVILGETDDRVKTELERFEFRVVSYSESGGGGGGESVSALGQFLIP